MIELDLVGFQ